MSHQGMQILFVSGLSGSGKSTTMDALEDRSFYCIDNLPPPLIWPFLDLCTKASPPVRKVALAIDAREYPFLPELPTVLAELRSRGDQVQLLFLDCSNEVLLNRYRETRRVHPLAPGGTVEEGIERERTLLEEVLRLADLVVDTSGMNVHQLRETVVQLVAGGTRRTVMNLVSFAFRHGVPQEVDLLFDVRFLPNPHFEPALRPRTGHDPEVAQYVLKQEPTQALLDRLQGLLEFLMPLYDAEGKAYLTVGIGCTGGRHRSVAIVNQLAEALRSPQREVNVRHRDVEEGT